MILSSRLPVVLTFALILNATCVLEAKAEGVKPPESALKKLCDETEASLRKSLGEKLAVQKKNRDAYYERIKKAFKVEAELKRRIADFVKDELDAQALQDTKDGKISTALLTRHVGEKLKNYKPTTPGNDLNLELLKAHCPDCNYAPNSPVTFELDGENLVVKFGQVSAKDATQGERSMWSYLAETDRPKIKYDSSISISVPVSKLGSLDEYFKANKKAQYLVKRRTYVFGIAGYSTIRFYGMTNTSPYYEEMSFRDLDSKSFDGVAKYARLDGEEIDLFDVEKEVEKQKPAECKAAPEPVSESKVDSSGSAAKAVEKLQQAVDKAVAKKKNQQSTTR